MMKSLLSKRAKTKNKKSLLRTQNDKLVIFKKKRASYSFSDREI
jgi:hypothetical protein